MDSWFEVALVATIFAVGNILFGHFEAETPKWRRVLKVLVMLTVTRLVTVRFGHPWALGLIGVLLAFDWPGNIRQLENTVYRAVVLSEGDMLGLSDFPQTVGHAMPDSQFAHTEPLVVAPSAAPSLVSGSDIPIAPLAAAGRHGKRDHPFRDLALPRADVGSRAPAQDRPLHALPQTR